MGMCQEGLCIYIEGRLRRTCYLMLHRSHAHEYGVAMPELKYTSYSPLSSRSLNKKSKVRTTYLYPCPERWGFIPAHPPERRGAML